MMKIDCRDRERVLRDQAPEELAALAQHAERCAECREELHTWNEISTAAPHMRKAWDSPALWPRIRQSLAEAGSQTRQESAGRKSWPWLPQHWQAAAAAVLLVVISGSGAWYLLRQRAPARPPDQRLLTRHAVSEVESAEAAYLKSIDNLTALARPKLEDPYSPLMASYREKLLLIDVAIAECRANIEHNRWNAHLRRELLSVYQDKERTLEEVLKED